MSTARRFLYLGLAAVVLLQTGCVSETVSGSEKIYTYQLYVSLLLFLGGIGAAVGGFFLRSNRFGWVLMIGGPIAAIGFAPTMFMEKITVDHQHFTVRNGFWGMSREDVVFDDLQMVNLTKEETRGRRGRKNVHYYLVCHRKNGTNAKIKVNNDVAEAAAEAIGTQFGEHNISVVNSTGEN
jgi:hypothetical protein